VYAGMVMVFILSLGFYVTPALVGGPRNLTIAT
jgi:ABC-type spermidine/putrescine transport system permease subunit I